MLILIFVLTACGSTEGGGAGAGGGATIPVDRTPHEYTFILFSPSPNTGSATMHVVCNHGAPDVRDYIHVANITPANFQSGGGCTGARNALVTVSAVSIQLIFVVTIDGVYHPELDKYVLPGDSYTFSRGF